MIVFSQLCLCIYFFWKCSSLQPLKLTFYSFVGRIIPKDEVNYLKPRVLTSIVL
uniref:Uncharacterized protein n=1 Tax=Anguilla anguilla TaxID=7936 RepID=A0A0E9X0X3_ANGAN